MWWKMQHVEERERAWYVAGWCRGRNWHRRETNRTYCCTARMSLCWNNRVDTGERSVLSRDQHSRCHRLDGRATHCNVERVSRRSAVQSDEQERNRDETVWHESFLLPVLILVSSERISTNLDVAVPLRTCVGWRPNCESCEYCFARWAIWSSGQEFQ